MREIENFPIKSGQAWLHGIGGRYFAVWYGTSSGNQPHAVAYQADEDGRPLPGWHEIVRERTLEKAVEELDRRVELWPPLRTPDDSVPDVGFEVPRDA